MLLHQVDALVQDIFQGQVLGVLVGMTMLVNSCDAYEDLWQPFFTLLKRYFAPLDMRILLNTESKDFRFEGLNIELPGKQWNHKRPCLVYFHDQYDHPLCIGRQYYIGSRYMFEF